MTQLEDEIVLAFAAVAGIAAAGAPAGATGRSLELVTRDKFAITGVDALAGTALTMMKNRFRHIFGRDFDFLPRIRVDDAASVDGVCHRSLELRLVALEETLSVDGTLAF